MKEIYHNAIEGIGLVAVYADPDTNDRNLISKEIRDVPLMGYQKVSMRDYDIKLIRATVVGLLESYRSKKLNRSTNKKFNHRFLVAEQDNWMTKFQLLQMLDNINMLQAQCIEKKKLLKIRATIYRQYQIQDYKNLVTGFDHIILDALVKRSVITNDNMKNIEYVIDQDKRKNSPNQFYHNDNHIIVEFSVSEKDRG